MFGRKTPAIITDEAKVDELVTRGVAEVVDVERLRQKLLSGRRLRVKLGIDPTSPDIHLGRAVLLLKLRDFQELGHQVVFIVGDATGVVGDTSDKESERPMLAQEVVERNLATYIQQVGLLVDTKSAEIVRNSTWLDKLSFRQVGDLADHFSVADFISRDNIKRRLDGGKRVSLRETLYPLMQGYDSVAVRADVEIGGTDQRFNLLAGRVLQLHAGQESQEILTMELIAGTDGRKMSSSWGNTINLGDEPNDMFGKVMRVDDSLVEQYFISCTRLSLDVVEDLKNKVAAGGNPRDMKVRLAEEVVGLLHSHEAATAAREQFIKTFSEGNVPDDTSAVKVVRGEGLCAILEREGLVASRSECRRLIEQGAIRDAETDEKIADWAYKVTKPLTLKVGKRRFLTIELS